MTKILKMSKQLTINTKDINSVQKLVSKLMTFMAICLPHYLTVRSGRFHFQLADILENNDDQLIEIIGFRGSAKTTMSALAFILQVVLTGRYHFIVLINDTGEQVEGNIFNIKTELENNILIKKFFPNFRLGTTWSTKNLLIEITREDGSVDIIRIVGRSRGQNIRGIRHKQYRPDCILVDDPENLEQVKKKESRDKTQAWFNGEVIPAAQENDSKVIVIGNFLHNDGFMARLAKNELFKVFRIPFYGEDGLVNWKGKYPTKASVERQRKKVGETSWSREYLLKIIAEEDQIIKETDIQRYPNAILTKLDERGDPVLKIVDAGAGMDLAISEKQTADFTAIIAGLKVEWNGTHVLIKPDYVKRRMDFDKTIKAGVEMKNKLPFGAKFYVEDVGYQKVAIQQLKKKGVPTVGVRPIADKRARLQSVAPYIIDGTVLFPEKGCEDLIQSLINFGIEEHDDDVDALVYLILGLITKSKARKVARIDQL